MTWGATDYISKPFNIKELNFKIEMLSGLVQTLANSKQVSEQTADILKDVQTQSANIQSITRFIQASMFCNDIDTLLKLFKKTAGELGVCCVIRINSESCGVVTESTNGVVSDLEREILDNAHQLKRIFTFGNNRAIFNWKNIQLLTRNLGNLIDDLAIFMDSLEVAVKSIDTESKLIKKVEAIEKETTQASDTISRNSQGLTTQLITSILAMGVVNELSEEEEDKLNEMILSFRKGIESELTTINSNNQTLKGLLAELKTPPADLEHLLHVDEESDNSDDIMLF